MRPWVLVVLIVFGVVAFVVLAALGIYLLWSSGEQVPDTGTVTSLR